MSKIGNTSDNKQKYAYEQSHLHAMPLIQIADCECLNRHRHHKTIRPNHLKFYRSVHIHKGQVHNNLRQQAKSWFYIESKFNFPFWIQYFGQNFETKIKTGHYICYWPFLSEIWNVRLLPCLCQIPLELFP